MNEVIHIGIDGNEANVSHRVGSNQYAYSLLQALYDNDHSAQFTVYLKSPPLPDMPAPKPNWQYRVLTPAKLWTQWRLPLDLFFNLSRPQVFFSPGHYAPRFSPIPTVVTIMDLAFIKYPNLFLKLKRGVGQLTQWTNYSVRHAAHVIAISQHTQTDIVQIYQKPVNQISVAYPGIDLQQFCPQPKKVINSTKQKYHLDGDYLLYVGTLQPRKNLSRVLSAFEALPRTFKNLKWVLAGQPGWLYKDFLRVLDKSPKRQSIIQLGYVQAGDLPALYTGARLTLLPGLYEGFGMPAAESLACGTLPLVANTASLPEVVGPAGIQVDPYSITSIKRGLLFGLKLSSRDYQKRVKLGQEHIRQFSWQNSAQVVRKVLYDLAIQRPHR